MKKEDLIHNFIYVWFFLTWGLIIIGHIFGVKIEYYTDGLIPLIMKLF